MMVKRLAKKDKTSSTEKKVESDFSIGDLILVESLTITKPRHGINSSMRKMIGGEFIVEDVRMDHSQRHTVVTLNDSSKHTWSFAPSDLKLVKNYLDISSEAMPTEPIMFDPNELI